MELTGWLLSSRQVVAAHLPHQPHSAAQQVSLQQRRLAATHYFLLTLEPLLAQKAVELRRIQPEQQPSLLMAQLQ